VTVKHRHAYTAGSLASDLVARGSPAHTVLDRLVADDAQHGWRLHPAACFEEKGCRVIAESTPVASGRSTRVPSRRLDCSTWPA